MWLFLLTALQFVAAAAAARTQNTAVAQRVFIQGVSALLHRNDIIVTGAEPTAPTQSIIIANHQTDADWVYPWLLTDDKHGDVKIILKDQFKRIPFIGWGLKVSAACVSIGQSKYSVINYELCNQL
jgi:1-acyl-sn-glycerol-3-phosphate acyltransferase